MYLCMCVYVYTYVCLYICMYMCTYVCTYVRMYVRTYVCMYYGTPTLKMKFEFPSVSFVHHSLCFTAVHYVNARQVRSNAQQPYVLGT